VDALGELCYVTVLVFGWLRAASLLFVRSGGHGGGEEDEEKGKLKDGLLSSLRL
jgi:hypothetical protein